jgi:hypothetical protein
MTKNTNSDTNLPSAIGTKSEQHPPTGGEGFSLQLAISWTFARLKLPIRVCVFTCIIWLIKCYIMSSLETRYAQLQIQIETLTSTINDLQQRIPPTDQEYHTCMNYI